MDAVNPLDKLLPQPKRIENRAGHCSFGRSINFEYGGSDRRIERALVRWETEWADAAPRGRFSAEAATQAPPSQPTTIEIGIEPHAAVANGHAQGYRLDVASHRINLMATTPEGCWNALQTLRRLIPSQGDRAPSVPCCSIEDWPDFDTRGVLLDITRGRVPTLTRLQSLVDRLSLLKINQLQLYIEHAFVFVFDPDVCDDQSGLTPHEVEVLDAFCRDRFVDLVPAVATLGHMGRLLSMPRYRHLAEVESDQEWSAWDWPARARGLTLDVTNSESHRLVERIWSDIGNAFSSPVVNICGDEPWDLGRGKNEGRWNDRRRGEVYLDHIRRTHDLCASHGRGTMFWSDVVVNYPELFDRVPRGSTVLHWGYDDKADYPAMERLVNAGLNTFACPGTSGWKRIINAMDLAERNIQTFARVGHGAGAKGLMNTDWGDHGHFNMPACSWHGLALGAALGWSAEHETGGTFDDGFARSEWGLADGELVGALRAASAMGAYCETWPMLWKPVERIVAESELPSLDALHEFREASHRAESFFSSARVVGASARQDMRELWLACRFNVLCADRMLLIRGLSDGAPHPVNRGRDARAWKDEITSCAHQYVELWRAHHKESGLPDILRALETSARELTETVSA